MQLIVYFINSFKVNEKEIYFSPQYSLNLFTAHQEQKKRGFYLRTTLYYKTLGSPLPLFQTNKALHEKSMSKQKKFGIHT